ncbi:MAG: purine-nucleoside phosphorylase [Acholeplasmatales bacterium]|nr:purine-nucleoside phosphorylase [Acholeplasmatales bacterium]
MSNIPTPHNGCDDENLIAKTVLMPGDPLRAKFIAENFLSNVECFTSVRNVLGYTGTYKGKRISVMASGMGMPSIGIYSYELFAFYGVENIVRIGSAGSYDKNLKIRDCVLVKDSYSESNYANVAFNYKNKIFKPSKVLNNKLKKNAKKLDIELKEARIHSSDVFYGTNPNYWLECKNKHKCSAVEMESFALFANAEALGKNAACLLTISDSFVESSTTTALERQNSFTDMMLIALELAE